MKKTLTEEIQRILDKHLIGLTPKEIMPELIEAIKERDEQVVGKIRTVERLSEEMILRKGSQDPLDCGYVFAQKQIKQLMKESL